MAINLGNFVSESANGKSVKNDLGNTKKGLTLVDFGGWGRGTPRFKYEELFEIEKMVEELQDKVPVESKFNSRMLGIVENFQRNVGMGMLADLNRELNPEPKQTYKEEAERAQAMLKELNDTLEYGDEVICQNLLTRYKEELEVAREAYRAEFSKLDSDEREAKKLLFDIYEKINNTLKVWLESCDKTENKGE